MGILERLYRVKALRSAGALLFEASRRIWGAFPVSWRVRWPLRAYGGFLQRLARLRQARAQSSWTCFLRNRAEIAYIGALGRAVRDGGRLSVAIFGCSTGAEAFSASYALRDSAGRIAIEIHASDISPANVAAAQAGRFAAGGPELEGLSAAEIVALFEPSEDGSLLVREPWRAPVRFAVADAMDPALARDVGTHDIVIANKFLCHMPEEAARRCLRNIVGTVRPGGVLLVSGVDLDVRSAIARDLGLIPDEAALAALHDGDITLRRGWPFDYWGLEPLDRAKADYAFRYAAAFRKPGANPFQREAGAAAVPVRAARA